jgi:hypothetical protein
MSLAASNSCSLADFFNHDYAFGGGIGEEQPQTIDESCPCDSCQ